MTTSRDPCQLLEGFQTLSGILALQTRKKTLKQLAHSVKLLGIELCYD